MLLGACSGRGLHGEGTSGERAGAREQHATALRRAAERARAAARTGHARAGTPRACDSSPPPSPQELTAESYSLVSMRSATSPTFFSAVVSSSGSSTSKASSRAMTDSTMSSESAPSSVSVAARVTFSLPTPSWSAITSATFPKVSSLAANLVTGDQRRTADPRRARGAEAPTTKACWFAGSGARHRIARPSTAAARRAAVRGREDCTRAAIAC
mmetsp:Transcript_103924/g.320560  ORF Transcript_103924/g.320560 Transcript_103924/m.320560 type:complete len:214 (+) Transcript_103924:181-822(+)